MWNVFRVNKNEVILVSLLLTLYTHHTLCWFFHCSLWTSKCCLNWKSKIKTIEVKNKNHGNQKACKITKPKVQKFQLVFGFHLFILSKLFKSYFSDKGNISKKIMLVQKNKTVHKGKNVAELMNNCFINITKTLNLKSSKRFNGHGDIMSWSYYLNLMII